MKKKSLLILMSTIVIVLLSLSGCGNDEKTEPGNEKKTLSDTVRIVTLNGAGEEATAFMPEGFQVDVFQKASEVEAYILNGSYDLAVVPSNTASKLYQQSGGDLVAVSPVALNDWFIISNKGYITSQQISNLKGKTIVACGQGGTGEAILRKLLEDNYINPDYGVRMKWVDTPAQVLEALKETYTVALLQEPFATQALGLSSSSNGLTSDIDLGALWEDQYHTPFPSDILIANKQFITERADDFQIFLSAYEESLDTAKESSTANLVFYGRSNRGIDLIKSFMASMEEYDITLLGGKSPDAAFYYGIGE
jgi:NitT/TauT family transport system substrate-binding protein